MDRSDPKVNRGSHRIDADAISAWMDNYCQAHPLDSIAKAADQFTLELSSSSP